MVVLNLERGEDLPALVHRWMRRTIGEYEPIDAAGGAAAVLECVSVQLPSGAAARMAACHGATHKLVSVGASPKLPPYLRQFHLRMRGAGKRKASRMKGDLPEKPDAG